MRFSSLGSGSKGNATVVHHGDTFLLIDCGFSVKETEKRLSLLGLQVRDLSGIAVTHEHSDHIRGVPSLAKKYQLPVLMTAGTHKSLKSDVDIDLSFIESDISFSLGDLEVTPVSVAHDAREPVQFVIRGGQMVLGILTDLGCVTPHVLENYRFCHGLLVECNHDTDMLAMGPYPPSLKHRVGGDWGHLNNQQAKHLLQNIQTEQLQQLVIGHISQKNNSLDLVKKVMSDVNVQTTDIQYASQDEGFSWIELIP